MSIGIDVNTELSASTWQQLKNAGVDFAFIKASEGHPDSSSSDLIMKSRFISNVTRATASGIMVGAYHYCHATNINTGSNANSTSVETEVGLLLSNVVAAGGYSKIKLPLVIDMEEDSLYPTTQKSANTNIAKSYACFIAKAGYEPCLYLNYDFKLNRYNMSDFGDLKLWFASYTDYSTAHSRCPTMSIWQKGTTQFPGITGTFDSDECYFTFSEPTNFDYAAYPGIKNKSGSPVYIDYTTNIIYVPQAYTDSQISYTIRNNGSGYSVLVNSTTVQLINSSQAVQVFTRESY